MFETSGHIVLSAGPWINWSSIGYPEEGTCGSPVCLLNPNHSALQTLWLRGERLERLLSEMSQSTNKQLWVLHGISWEICLQVSAISGHIYHTSCYQERTTPFKCFQSGSWWLQKATLVPKGLRAFSAESSAQPIRLDKYLDSYTGRLRARKRSISIFVVEERKRIKSWWNVVLDAI